MAHTPINNFGASREVGQSVVVVSFSPIPHDQRIQRQLRAIKLCGLRPVVVGFDCAWAMPEDLQDVIFHRLPAPGKSLLRRTLSGALLSLGKWYAPLIDAAFWQRPWMHEALKFLRTLSPPSLIIGNDLEGVAVALKYRAAFPRVKILFDAHEYFLNVSSGREESLRGMMRRRILMLLAPQADVMTTVCGPLSHLYEQEVGRPCGVVYNATAMPVDLTQAPTEWDGVRKLRLVHHGLAARDRGLERMVQAMAFAPNAELHFYLTGDTSGYVSELQSAGDSLAPGRVYVHPPVKPSEIAQTLVPYDLGFSVIAPSSTSLLNSLPNKFFDCLNAGLGVIIGPSPAMAELVTLHDCGAVAASFESRDLGELLARLTPNDVARIRRGGLKAANTINHDTECRKVAATIIEQLSIH